MIQICRNQVHTGTPHILCLTTTVIICVFLKQQAPEHRSNWRLYTRSRPPTWSSQRWQWVNHDVVERKRHVKARNLTRTASCEWVVGGNETGTTYLTSASSNSTYTTEKNVARWSSQSYLWARCTKTSRKSTKSHESGVVWMHGWWQWVKQSIFSQSFFQSCFPIFTNLLHYGHQLFTNLFHRKQTDWLLCTGEVYSFFFKEKLLSKKS